MEGMTPRPGIMRIVALLFSGEDIVVKVLDFWSAMVTAKVGIRRMAVSPVAFNKAVPGLALLVGISPAPGAELEPAVGEGCVGVT